MDALAARLARARRFASAMKPETKAVDEALPQVRALFVDAKLPYRIVGGLAVLHHGYARTTEDIDLLVGHDAWERLSPYLATHGFERTGAHLRHVATGVRVDLLVEGHRLAKPGSEPFPSPESTPASDDDPTVVALSALVDLKLQANRHQDLADIVALLKRMDDGEYITLEAAIGANRRLALARLREDALEELSFEPD